MSKIGQNSKKIIQTSTIAPKVRRIVNRNPGVKLLHLDREEGKARPGVVTPVSRPDAPSGWDLTTQGG